MKSIRKRKYKPQFFERVGLDNRVIPDTALCARHFRMAHIDQINADHPGKLWVKAPHHALCIVCGNDFD